MEIDPSDRSRLTISDGTKTANTQKSSKPQIEKSSSNANGELRSPMPGVILKYLVEIGQEVHQGDPVAVLEAMKMENTLPAPKDGHVESLPVEPGQTVVKGDILAIIT